MVSCYPWIDRYDATMPNMTCCNIVAVDTAAREGCTWFCYLGRTAEHEHTTASTTRAQVAVRWGRPGGGTTALLGWRAFDVEMWARDDDADCDGRVYLLSYFGTGQPRSRRAQVAARWAVGGAEAQQPC